MRFRIVIGLSLATWSGVVCGCRRSAKEVEAGFLQRGQAQMAAKDYARAALEFSNAVRAMPGDAEPYYQLGLAYLASGASSQAAASFVKATGLNPGHVQAQLKLSELMVRAPDPNVVIEGAKRAGEALESWPDNVDAADTLAFAQFRLGNFESAEQQIRGVLAKYPNTLKPSITLAGMRLASRDFAGAEQALKSVVAAAPDSAQAAIAMGNLYALVGRWPEAETQFRAAIRLDEKDAAAWLGLAAAQVRSGKASEAEETYRRISSMPGSKHRHAHAAFLFAEGKREEAVRELESLAKANPRDRIMRARLIEAYFQVNRTADAEVLIAEALKADPRDMDALARRSVIEMAAGKHMEAEATLNLLMKQRGAAASAHFLFATLAQARGDALRERSELSQALEANPGMLPARTMLAQRLVTAGAAGAALELIAKAPESQKRMASLLAVRGVALLASGDAVEARKNADAGLAVARTPDLLMQDAFLKVMKRDYAGARASAVEVLGADPTDLRGLRMAAATYIAEDRRAAALEFVEDHAAKHPQSPAVQHFAGEAVLGSGNARRSRGYFEAALRANPRFFAAGLALAQLDLADGQPDAAARRLGDILALDKSHAPAHVWMGMIDEKAGNRDSAAGHYRKALATMPNNVVALNNLAALLTESDLNEALQYAQHAQGLDPRNPDVGGTLGWILYRRGVYDSAVAVLRDAVASDGPSGGKNAAVRRYRLAMAYTKTGDLDRGQKLLDEALKINANIDEAAAARELVHGPAPRPGGARR